MSLVAYGNSDASSDEDDESQSPPTVTRHEDGGSKLTGSFLSSLPAPKSRNQQLTSSLLGLPPPKNQSDSVSKPTPSIVLPKQKNTVKISLPQLHDSDSDEADEPVVKRPKTTGGSGLMSLLPQPKKAVTKETKRPLIPYSLTKKPSQTGGEKLRAVGSVKPGQTVKSLVTGVESDDDDDDDGEEDSETSNFFSIVEKSQHPPQTLPVTSTQISSDIRSDVSNSDKTEQHPSNITQVVGDCSTDTTQNEPLTFTNVPHYMPDADAPLVFKGGKTSQVTDPPRGVFTDVYSGYQTQYDTQSADVDVNDGNQQDVSQYLHDEQFLRMQGKRHRGKEAINIIDVNADDQMATEIQMTRAISEETPSMSTKKNKEDMPSTQQRRKHQITYLAHQAREREFELKNQWASNRATKKQTQAKYGF